MQHVNRMLRGLIGDSAVPSVLILGDLEWAVVVEGQLLER